MGVLHMPVGSVAVAKRNGVSALPNRLSLNSGRIQYETYQ